MAVMNGTLMSVTVGSSSINLQTECSISLSREMSDVSTKDSTNNYKEVIPRQKSGSVSFSILHDEGATYNLQQLWDLYDDGTESVIKFTTGTVGDFEFTSDAYLSSLEMNAGTEDNVTVSGTFELTGDITYVAITG